MASPAKPKFPNGQANVESFKAGRKSLKEAGGEEFFHHENRWVGEGGDILGISLGRKFRFSMDGTLGRKCELFQQNCRDV